MWSLSDAAVGGKGRTEIGISSPRSNPACLTRPYRTHKADIGIPVPRQAILVPISTGSLEDEFEMDQILGQRKRGREYQWLEKLKGTPTHSAQWQARKVFIYTDREVTDALLDYMSASDISHSQIRGNTVDEEGSLYCGG